MDGEKFVLSAHGSAMNTDGLLFDIPNFITLYTYSALNTCANYDNSDPGKVCWGTPPPVPVNMYHGGIGRQFPDFMLWSDESDEGQKFFSGVKRCKDNSVFIDIDKMPIRCSTTRWCRYKILLSEIVGTISEEMQKTPHHGTAEIHLLICLGQVAPGVMEMMEHPAPAAPGPNLTQRFGNLSISPGGGGGSRRRRKSRRGRMGHQRKNRSNPKSKSNRRRKPRR